MRRLLFVLTLLTVAVASAQNEESENGIVTIGRDRIFQIESPDGEFSFKPYMLIHTNANYNYYDDEGLDKAYNQDNVANSGFAVPYAVLGFTGKAFSRVSYNLSINAAANGGQVLQQAWFDVRMNRTLAVKVGKFKTPFSHAYLTTLGESLMPQLPNSLTASVILPYSLNAVTPNVGTGFDLGVMVHGWMGKYWAYETGLFNGTGAATNSATKTLSDDWHIPSLLYAARIAWMPMGAMPASQGNPHLRQNKLMIAGSANMNVESEYESTNDFRCGIEAAWLYDKLYVGAEFYYMNVGFTDRQKINESYNYLGGYVQAGYFVGPQVQLAARYDMMDRNGIVKDGMLNMPAVGANYFFKDCGLKLQAMWQFVGRTNHKTQLDRDLDDLGVAKHSATMSLQYTF